MRLPTPLSRLLPKKDLTEAEIRAKIETVPYWWHNMELLPGIRTPGHDMPAEEKARHINIPTVLRGKTVLDIGASNGFFSFEAEKRGAKKVVALNLNHNRGLAVAKEILDSRVECITGDVCSMTPDTVGGAYDIVFFFGVLYHLKSPFAAVERLYPVTKEMLMVESYVIDPGGQVPLMQFYPGNELNQDPSNWWGPNVLCIEQMLSAAGFQRIERSGLYAGNRAVLRAFK